MKRNAVIVNISAGTAMFVRVSQFMINMRKMTNKCAKCTDHAMFLRVSWPKPEIRPASPHLPFKVILKSSVLSTFLIKNNLLIGFTELQNSFTELKYALKSEVKQSILY